MFTGTEWKKGRELFVSVDPPTVGEPFLISVRNSGAYSARASVLHRVFVSASLFPEPGIGRRHRRLTPIDSFHDCTDWRSRLFPIIRRTN